MPLLVLGNQHCSADRETETDRLQSYEPALPAFHLLLAVLHFQPSPMFVIAQVQFHWFWSTFTKIHYR